MFAIYRSIDYAYSYLANYSLAPVMHARLCLSLVILYGENRVICTPTKLKLA